MHSMAIYHNPNCGTSRNTLALIRHMGFEPQVIHYLENPPDETTLRGLLSAMNITPRQLLRTNVPEFMACGLDNEQMGDDDVIKAMLANPILINRPIVMTEKGVKLCRPSELFLDISPVPLLADFVKENGEIIAKRG
ncbi:arsenate reductase (glutaredoxin) [Moraxella sp. FZLJ2107]|uniref:arsenate reductase (glutaredoxin) n=1 Tax=unclassified Moraxella TaxID=2685852 RepID=UPI0020C8D2F3|nr:MULTISPECIES: arsenate reductase (glutaredoxin) [unclassified Moraxella]UTO04694.1 arsenate reductase (glutaredoxin) [Moraxella sp. FZLJ2107]UTO21422.1 arsenate reductase (glutaredoxin) [Moraxella sp. FZLJ2109]